MRRGSFFMRSPKMGANWELSCVRLRLSLRGGEGAPQWAGSSNTAIGFGYPSATAEVSSAIRLRAETQGEERPGFDVRVNEDCTLVRSENGQPRVGGRCRIRS
jgi:hypothetical protein